MDFIDGFDKKIKSIEDAEKKFDSEMNKIIKAFDKIDKKDVGESAYKAAQLTAKNLNMLLSVGKVPSGVQQAIYKEANGQFERALKGFLRFKPAKEGMEFEEPATDSLLEQAMKLYC